MESIISQSKPHFYEYMEVSLLQHYIQKGISYITKSILDASPKLIPLRYYSEQITFLINFIKDFICLLKYAGTYAEQFYSLERKNLLQASKQSRNLKIVYQTLIMTLIPYLLNKLDKHYNVLIQEQSNQGRELKVPQKIFTALYPYIYMLFSSVQVMMKFRYLLQKKTKIFDLYYKISNEQLLHSQTNARYQSNDKKVHYPWMDLVKTPGLLTLILGHKIVDWYFKNKNQRKNQISKRINLIDRYVAPLQNQNSEGYIKMTKQSQLKQKNKGLCLICSKQIVNPTVIKLTGHVYCYNCIASYIKSNQRCPMTGIKVTHQNLQLVYSSQSN